MQLILASNENPVFIIDNENKSETVKNNVYLHKNRDDLSYVLDYTEESERYRQIEEDPFNLDKYKMLSVFDKKNKIEIPSYIRDVIDYKLTKGFLEVNPELIIRAKINSLELSNAKEFNQITANEDSSEIIENLIDVKLKTIETKEDYERITKNGQIIATLLESTTNLKLESMSFVEDEKTGKKYYSYVNKGENFKDGSPLLFVQEDFLDKYIENDMIRILEREVSGYEEEVVKNDIISTTLDDNEIKRRKAEHLMPMAVRLEEGLKETIESAKKGDGIDRELLETITPTYNTETKKIEINVLGVQAYSTKDLNLENDNNEIQINLLRHLEELDRKKKKEKTRDLGIEI